MDNIIVYVDDAEYALHQLKPMGGSQSGEPTHWILVACPPRMTRHISKWVNHAARQNWRTRWAERLYTQLAPGLRSEGDRITQVLAHGPLVEMSRELIKTHGTARVLDARRPKFGQDLVPVTQGQPPAQDARWTVPSAVAGMGAFLVLASE